MRDNLRQGMVLFDVGTEHGWCNLIYASYVGGENMVLIEPTPSFWPNIKATWEKNDLWGPRGFYDGLLSDKTTDTRTGFRDWPAASVGPLIDRNKYQYIHDNGAGIPEMRFDDLVLRMGVVPDAITIDVEGAELLVLRGAERTMRERHPLVWVSVHPDMLLRDYGTEAGELHAFMADLGYTGEHLATDHEEHWFFHA
jgi:FkbM family methyltransferase